MKKDNPKENPKDLPDPLMFIHTVSTKGKTTSPQVYFDSAETHPLQEKPLKDEKLEKLKDNERVEAEDLEDFFDTKDNFFQEEMIEEDIFEEKENTLDPDLVEREVPLLDMLRVKLENIIMMYQNGRPVECTIITENEEINCYPYELKSDILLVKADNEDLQVALKDLVDIYIIKF